MDRLPPGGPATARCSCWSRACCPLMVVASRGDRGCACCAQQEERCRCADPGVAPLKPDLRSGGCRERRLNARRDVSIRGCGAAAGVAVAGPDACQTGLTARRRDAAARVALAGPDACQTGLIARRRDAAAGVTVASPDARRARLNARGPDAPARVRVAVRDGRDMWADRSVYRRACGTWVDAYPGGSDHSRCGEGASGGLEHGSPPAG